MKYLFIIPLLLTTYFVTVAQGDAVEPDDVLWQELSMRRYSADSTAGAVIIFDNGSSTLASVGARALTYKRNVKIKIFRKDAFDEWANVALLVERGAFSKLKGVTYNLENGRVVKSEIDDNSIFKKRFNKHIDEIKFTLPQVKEGSVIEYSYAIKGDGLPPWQFQYSIPVIRSEYTVDVPVAFILRHSITGLLSPQLLEKKGVRKWTLNNVPAFKAEPLMPNESDYVSAISFLYSLGTWDGINSRMLHDENFWGTINGFPFLKKEAQEVTAKLTDPKQKIIAIQHYIKNHFTWDGTEDIYAADNLKDNFIRKAGTAADINLAMASMLHKAGIRVEMVLLSTRGNGFVRMDYPTTRQFNYTICVAYADTTAYLLDATEKHLPWNVLPKRCLNGVGLVVSDKGYTWIDVNTKVKSRTVVTADVTLNGQGDLQGRLTYTRQGYAAYEMRDDFARKGKTPYMEDFVKNRPWSVLKSEFQNLDDVEKPAIETHEILIKQHGNDAGGFIYIDPFIALKEEENPFKVDQRKFSIDFVVLNEKVYLTNITIPDGYLVDEIPKTLVLTLPDNKGKFTYATSQIGNRLTVVSNIHINERVFMPDEYPILKEFYNRIVAKQAEQIVLKKK
ncbi:DUF3857 domain-containing protein [Chryseolinea sp. H1M3-3]|uniref:DUF3857 domain-containing protein n=1 Tax=Chryseolinea sp. H1M3-3 TaxID=3034144 RepID=UPI0023ECF9C1|nr:DUF3857 domain-containing protein [Chryseolinea sp. H1M3-3]